MIDDLIVEDVFKIKKDLRENVLVGKRVLVSGGAGFIGSWLCDLLIVLGNEITCVDDFSTGKMNNVDHLVKNQKFKIVKDDVSAFNGKGKFDFIFHLAAHASPEEYQKHPIETLKASSLGSANMAELARKNDCGVLFASTSEVYGDADVVPTPESYWGKVNPIGPRSCYDEGKRFAEALFAAYHGQYRLDVRIARIFNSYGPRLREDGLYGRALSRFVMQALTDRPITIFGDGKQTRSFCYISDTVTALMLLATNDRAAGEVVNVGTPQEITILHLAGKIKESTKCRSSLVFRPLPKDDPKRRCPDTRKIENLLNWQPKVNLEEGLARTIAWFSSRTRKAN